MACARIFCSSCLVSGRGDKVFASGKVENLSRFTLPQFSLVPETSSKLHVNGRLNLLKEISEKLARHG